MKPSDSSRLHNNERGSILLLGLAFIFILFLIAGIVLDMHRGYVARDRLRNIAEAMALAGADEINGTYDGVVNGVASRADVKQVILQLASEYGVDGGDYTFAWEVVQYNENTGGVNSFPAFEADSTAGAMGGVGPAVLANGVRVILTQTIPTYLLNPVLAFSGGGTINSLTLTSSATAVSSSPVEACVAPFALPICGLAYENNVGQYKKYDIGNKNSAMRQEILFGPLQNPDGLLATDRPFHYPTTWWDLDTASYSFTELGKPNNSDTSWNVVGENKSDYPDLPLGIPGEVMETNSGTPSGTSRFGNLFPLRGGFAVPETAKAGADARTDDVLQILSNTWNDGAQFWTDGALPKFNALAGAPLGSPKGCVPARIGERAYLLDGSPTAPVNESFFSDVFDPGPGANVNSPVTWLPGNDAMQATHLLSALIHSNDIGGTAPDEMHSHIKTALDVEETMDSPAVVELSRGECDPAVVGAANWTGSKYPEGRGGCHVHGPNSAMYACGNIAVDGNPGTDGVNCDTSPLAVARFADNHPIWKTMAMIVAPSNAGDNYCGSNVGTTKFDNSSNPVIVGFMPIWVFDAQVYKPGPCKYKDSANVWSTDTEQHSCRGVRAKPAGELVLHSGYNSAVVQSRLVN